jgi:hypothetical protein
MCSDEPTLNAIQDCFERLEKIGTEMVVELEGEGIRKRVMVFLANRGKLHSSWRTMNYAIQHAWKNDGSHHEWTGL